MKASPIFPIKALTIKSWLIALLLLAQLPILIFSYYLINQIGKSREQAILAELQFRTASTANSINRKLATSLGYLNALAESDAAISDDISKLYYQAQRIIENNEGAAAISLISDDGKIIFLTLRPLESKLLIANDWESAREVFKTGKPVLSQVFHSPINNQFVTAIGVPVYQNSKIKYCLRMIFTSNAFNQILLSEDLPKDWTAVLADQKGLIVARSRSPDKFIGKSTSSSLLKLIKRHYRGVTDTFLREGTAVKTAIVDIPGWDWTVAIGVPKKTLIEPISDAILSILIFGIGLGFVALMLGARLAQYIAREITYLAEYFFKIQNGILNTSLSKITEINQIKSLFQEIVLREKNISSALEDLALKHEEVQTKLDQAQKDTLTGLLSRGLFFQIVQSMKLKNCMHSQSKAILFIDLDGFKNVNDIHGHDRGDLILKKTADILKTLIRETDLACRFGGDEFVIYLEASEIQMRNLAIAVGERIVHGIHEIGYGIGCSIGIAFSDSEFNIEECLRQADLAMYEAKRKGKNQYVVYSGLQAKHRNYY